MHKNKPNGQLRIVFWQNMISIHQAALLRALAYRADVLLVVDHEIEATRRSTGWSVPDTTGITVIVAPDRQKIAELATSTEQTVHFVSGFGAYPSAKRALLSLRQRPSHHALVVGVEPWDPRGVKGALRRIVYTFHVKRWQHILDLLVTTGRNAYRQFESIGAPSTRLAPFAYFSEAPSLEPTSVRSGPWSFAYVGRLEPLKNVGSVIRALSGVTNHDWSLDIVGDGAQREELESLVVELGVRERVRFHGMLPNDVTLQKMNNWDTLILPSAYDGWGYVVNEAIVRGLRCLVSDAAGTHDVIDASPSLGRVFRSSQGDDDLARCISLELGMGRLTNEDRQTVSAVALERIGADVGANYVLQLCEYALHHEALMPSAPWER